MRAVRRIGLLGFVLGILFVAYGYAVPIKPDLEKILKQQEQPPRPYEPARAGWDGPEMVRPQEASPNVVYETYGPASTARAVRAALRAAATPDPVALFAIGALILLLRLTRRERVELQRAAVPRADIDSGERKAA
jgi:hypothetical protein